MGRGIDAEMSHLVEHQLPLVLRKLAQRPGKKDGNDTDLFKDMDGKLPNVF